MKERWVTLRLGGYLGRAFGKRHKFLVTQSRDAIKAFCLQVPEFKRSLEEAESKGIRFAVYNGKHNIKDVDELSLGAKDEIKIVPVYHGSKRAGGMQTIIGIALVVAATVFSGGTFAGVAGTAWGAVGAAGIAMTVGGAVQLLNPQSTAGLKTKEDDENKSYAFGGPVNTTAQGNPVGVLYGKREVGGAIISASIVAEDQQ